MSSQPRYWAVVPAAGSGSRMQADRPKQYLQLHGKTVLEHTLERFAGLAEITEIVVCVAADDPYWETLRLPAKVRRVDGGRERHESVFNGLQALADRVGAEDWVLVHDAARPCVREEDVRRLIAELEAHPVGGLLALPVRDTMKRADAGGEILHTVSREHLWHALTPQMFRFGVLFKCLQKVRADGTNITDDAQAIEYCGLPARLVAGHADNLKITHPQDLALAELFLSRQTGNT